MSDSSYDLIVIGSGPGGYVAAIHASKLGLKTAVVEKKPVLGGTCLNVGCIPSKALLASSEHYHFAQHRFAKHGIIAQNLSIDLEAMMKRKNDVVSGLRKGIEFLFKQNKIDRVTGYGKVVSPNRVGVSVEGKKTQFLEARHILLATGSSPVELPFLPFDGTTVVSSDQAIAFPEVPKSLIVIGAGAIGLELGSVWQRLGSQVTVLEFLPRIAAGCDGEISTALQKLLTKQGLSFELNTQVQSAKIGKKGVKLTAKQGKTSKTFEAEKVLVAVGRKPFTQDLGLEELKIETTEKNQVCVDSHWQTSIPGIYAIGDIIEGPMLAHKAEAEGVAVAECIAKKAGQVNYSVIPNVIYTSPEVASVGLTSEEAKKQGLEIRTGKYQFMANGRAKASDTTDGFAKIIADKNTDRVLGAHILASNASELIAECGVLMEFQGSAEDLFRTIHAHPTMAEVVKEAAHAAYSH